MHETLTLNRLAEGQSAYVTEMDPDAALCKRLYDLGLIRGTRVTCLYHSPAGDPAAYLIRGAVIALRCRDARHIQVKPIPVSAPALSNEVSLPWA